MIDRKTVKGKYAEISRLETLEKRREFLGKQSPEMRVALWLENVQRKTKSAALSAEQEEILEIIKKKFITVEFAEFARGKSENEAGPEYIEIMGKASRIFGKHKLRELFLIPGDSETLDSIC